MQRRKAEARSKGVQVETVRGCEREVETQTETQRLRQRPLAEREKGARREKRPRQRRREASSSKRPTGCGEGAVARATETDRIQLSRTKEAMVKELRREGQATHQVGHALRCQYSPFPHSQLLGLVSLALSSAALSAVLLLSRFIDARPLGFCAFWLSCPCWL